MKPLILLGGGGHASVLLDLILLKGGKIEGWVGPDSGWKGVPWLGEEEILDRKSPDQCDLVLAFGTQTVGSKRKKVFEKFVSRGFQFPAQIHPSSSVASSALIGEGSQIMSGAIIQSGAVLQENVIVNTRASVDHGCLVQAHVHLGPGVVVCGGAEIFSESFIGAGTTVLPKIRIGNASCIGAMSLVNRDLPDHIVAYGIPARIQQKK